MILIVISQKTLLFLYILITISLSVSVYAIVQRFFECLDDKRGDNDFEKRFKKNLDKHKKEFKLWDY